MERGVWWAVVGAVFASACSSAASRPSIPIEVYRPKDARIVAVSSSGMTAVLGSDGVVAVPRFEFYMRSEMRLVERASGRELGAGRGFIAGRPGDREAYIYDDRRFTAMTSEASAVLDLPELPEINWDLAWATIDHAGGTALLAVQENRKVGASQEPDVDRDRGGSRYELVEVDLKSMAERGRTTISMLGSKMSADEVAATIAKVETAGGTRQRVYGSSARACTFANTADVAQVFLICRVPEDSAGKIEHWVASRYDGRTLAWSTAFEVPTVLGGGNIAAAVTGDGKTLVLAHGDMSSGMIDAENTILIDTATGAARLVPRDRKDPAVELGKVADLVPVPGTGSVAQIHRYEPAAHSGGSRSFHGLSLVDGTTGAMKVILDTSRTRRDLRDSVPDTVVVLPNGTYLLGI